MKNKIFSMLGGLLFLAMLFSISAYAATTQSKDHESDTPFSQFSSSSVTYSTVNESEIKTSLDSKNVKRVVYDNAALIREVHDYTEVDEDTGEVTVHVKDGLIDSNNPHTILGNNSTSQSSVTVLDNMGSGSLMKDTDDDLSRRYKRLHAAQEKAIIEAPEETKTDDEEGSQASKAPEGPRVLVA